MCNRHCVYAYYACLNDNIYNVIDIHINISNIYTYHKS